MCSKSDPLLQLGPTVWACDRQPNPSDPDGQVVYDLLPLDPVTQDVCVGEQCLQACMALDQYQTFLRKFSPFRSRLVNAMVAGECPLSGDSAGERYVAEMVELTAALTAVLHSMRGAEHTLVATCVAPSRTGRSVLRSNEENEQQSRSMQ